MVRELRRLSALSVIILMIILIMSSYAAPAYGLTQHMFDDEGFMTDQELAYVDNYLSKWSDSYQFDIVGAIIYEGYDEEDLTTFADDFYDYGGFGYGDDKDGAIFVVDMDSRLMVLVTTGEGMEAITDYGEEVIYDYVTESLQEEDFAGAFEKYADTVCDFVQMEREGSPVDYDAPGHDGYDWYQGDEYTDGEGYTAPGINAENLAGMGGISAVFGALVGFFSSSRHKSKLKTVRRKTQANSYARRGSLVLTRKADRFLYSTVAVTPRPKENRENRPMGGGGGTSMHMGSSGVPHGGGHARGF